MQAWLKEGGKLNLTPRRFVAEGNFVLVLSEGDLPSGLTALYDLFRVEDGKIVEHWDVLDAHTSAGSVEKRKWAVLGGDRAAIPIAHGG